MTAAEASLYTSETFDDALPQLERKECSAGDFNFRTRGKKEEKMNLAYFSPVIVFSWGNNRKKKTCADVLSVMVAQYFSSIEFNIGLEEVRVIYSTDRAGRGKIFVRFYEIG